MTEVLREALARRGRVWGQVRGTVDRELNQDEHSIAQIYNWGTEDPIRIATHNGAFRRYAPAAE